MIWTQLCLSTLEPLLHHKCVHLAFLSTFKPTNRRQLSPSLQPQDPELVLLVRLFKHNVYDVGNTLGKR